MEPVKRRRWIAFLLVVLTGTAHADVITDWNEKAAAAGVKAQAGVMQARNAAIVHVAMFDALNAIERRYTPYRVQLGAAPGTARDVAAAAAAHAILAHLYPRLVDAGIAGNRQRVLT
jgi:hypothetical protein